MSVGVDCMLSLTLYLLITMFYVIFVVFRVHVGVECMLYLTLYLLITMFYVIFVVLNVVFRGFVCSFLEENGLHNACL